MVKNDMLLIIIRSLKGRTVVMETFLKYDYMIEHLNKGEEARCKKCRKGIYRPYNPKSKINHIYVCDKCGSRFQWEPAVEVE